VYKKSLVDDGYQKQKRRTFSNMILSRHRGGKVAMVKCHLFSVMSSNKSTKK